MSNTNENITHQFESAPHQQHEPEKAKAKGLGLKSKQMDPVRDSVGADSNDPKQTSKKTTTVQ